MKKKTSLLALLMKVKDKRNASGKRHQLVHILLIIIMGTMSGYEGFRGLDAFAMRYRDDLIGLLQISRKETPSMATLRRVMISVDFNQLSFAMYKWIRGRIKIRNKEWIASDGKGIKGTVKDYNSKYQNFVSLVSLYCSRAGVVLCSAAFSNKQESEIAVLRQLLQSLDIQGAVLTADAMHCQKKRWQSW